jgi:hypothetical protein
VTYLFLSPSPDGSKYPFGLGFSPKDIVDSGTIVDEMTKTSAPKLLEKNSIKYYNSINISI